jgi:carboxyl-terminal processing protease
MPGYASPFRTPRGLRRGAALTLLFAGVLGMAAATDLLPAAGGGPHGARAGAAAPAEDDRVVAAAARAVAHGGSGTDAAEEVVSRSGDRWGSVYDKGEYEEFEQALDGRYTGVGIGARRTADGSVEVTRVRAGGPAARAGVRTGDLIRDIDATPVAGRPVTEAMGLLRGDDVPGGPDGGAKEAARPAAPGSALALVLDRGGRSLTVGLRRQRLTVDPVSVAALPGGARRITVDAFTRGSGAEVREDVRDAPMGAGIVLDLRGNGGGLVSEAVTAASAFLDGGLVATYDVKGAQHALYAQRGGDTARPLVVLVDSGTMSAAELVTGALQDRGRAVVVGSPTFGKGAVQEPSRLADGSVAELTVGHYRTPSGRAVDGRGIAPDVPGGRDAERTAGTVLGGLGGAA